MPRTAYRLPPISLSLSDENQDWIKTKEEKEKIKS